MSNEVLNSPGSEEGQVKTMPEKPEAPSAPVDSGEPRLGYEVIKSDQRSPGEREAAESQHHPYLADLNARLREMQLKAPIKKQPPPRAQIPDVSKLLQGSDISKLLQNPTNRFAIIGIVLGIMVAVAVAAISLHHSIPDGRYDMGAVTSTDAGLTGHLFIRWEKQLEYRLTLEPSSPELHPGFSLAVGNSPRPLAVTINLQDSTGFVLCTTGIVVPYDAARAAQLAASNPPNQNGGADSGAGVEAVDYPALAAQEVSREQVNDVFVNQVGPNEQIESISAQGSLSCSKDAYQKAATWSFAPDFLSLAEQESLLKRLTRPKEYAAEAASQAAADRLKKAPKNPKKPPLFFIEGDDAIVDYDAASGVISTRSGRAFAISKAGAEADALKGRDFPFEIHYKCGQPGLCVLGGAGGRVTSSATMIR
jgi:hypothetical protein